MRSDVVLELSWRHGILDFAMPYFVQFIREYVGKVSTLLSGQSGSCACAINCMASPQRETESREQ